MAEPAVVEYESDRELRDTEQIPLMEEGGIEAFPRREVLPYAPDAWYVPASVEGLGTRSASYAALLQADAAAVAGGDPGGHPGVGAGDGRAASDRS